MTLRDRLQALAHPAQPVFEPSGDPALIAFAKLFADSGLVGFDATKHLRTDSLSPIYDCETESCPDAASEPERFVAVWSPVWHHDDPVTGFRTGRDSVFLGSTPTVAMPQDERTAALLLLVTSTFVHLSARFEDGGPCIQGALDAGGLNYRFVTLAVSEDPEHDPAAFSRPAQASPEWWDRPRELADRRVTDDGSGSPGSGHPGDQQA